MTTEGSTKNESRYRNLIESILRESLLFRNPGRFGPSNKTFRHQDVSDLDVYLEVWYRIVLMLKRLGPYMVPFYYLFPIYGYPKFIFGHLKMYFWISIIHFWISKNRFMDILKYIFGYPKISSLLDIHSSIFGYPKMNNGYP